MNARIDIPTQANACLLVVDIQGRLAGLVDGSAQMIQRCRILIQACRRLDVPIIWTEQVPDKLGPTVLELREALDGLTPISKSSFGCLGNQAIEQAIEQSGRDHVLLCGIETHICVWQTAVALRRKHYQVHLQCDASSSRSAVNRQIAQRRMHAAGVHLSNVEMVLFELMNSADHPAFRDITRLLK